jgi:hypothetical protein
MCSAIGPSVSAGKKVSRVVVVGRLNLLLCSVAVFPAPFPF